MMDSRNGDTPLKVGISGSYGGFNLGDEAILQVIIDELRRSTALEITVFSRDAKDTRNRHRVDHVVELRGICARWASRKTSARQ
jgi:polysaccharide pyruvyl transferase WcaK-like protein